MCARLKHIHALLGRAHHRFNERKRFQPGKGKKQKIPHTNNYGHGLCWWHIASGKYTRPSWIPAGGIGFHVCTDKTEYMCFDQRGNISILKGGSLKLVDKFTYLGSSFSSTEKDINMRLAKAWTAIDSQIDIGRYWKSDLTDKIKCRFFPSSDHVDAYIWMHHMDTK